MSEVQPLLSSHAEMLPATHDPPEHWSPEVQALPSEQGFVLFVYAQAPVAGLHVSVVQMFVSAQLLVGPPMQDPLRH